VYIIGAVAPVLKVVPPQVWLLYAVKTTADSVYESYENGNYWQMGYRAVESPIEAFAMFKASSILGKMMCFDGETEVIGYFDNAKEIALADNNISIKVYFNEYVISAILCALVAQWQLKSISKRQFESALKKIRQMLIMVKTNNKATTQKCNYKY
jgi:hypothetical protein